jgi:2-succinyl-6-hydroxy-2,4-cyclohexadiene-1-carboxylate synthase
MDALGIQRATIAGYSMGGRLALYLALRYPERCASLFLESASPGIEDEEERTARREADEEWARCLESGDFEAFLQDWYVQPLFASLARHGGMVGRLIESRKNNDPVELAKSLRGMGTGSQPSLWKELPGLTVLVLTVVGELDRKFVGIARRMSGLSPKMRAALISGAGHNAHLESPEEYTRLLQEIIESND